MKLRIGAFFCELLEIGCMLCSLLCYAAMGEAEDPFPALFLFLIFALAAACWSSLGWYSNYLINEENWRRKRCRRKAGKITENQE